MMPSPPSSRPSLESLDVTRSESIRVLSWEGSPAQPLLHRGKTARQLGDGMGDRWHYHPQLELTHYAAGEGLRFIGESIERFRAPDTVLIGSFLPHRWTCQHSRGYVVQWRLSVDSGFARLPEFDATAELWQRASGGLHLRGRLARATAEQMEALTHTRGLARLALFFGILANIANAPDEEWSILSRPFQFRAGKGAYAETMAEAIEYLMTHFREPIGLGDVLQRVSLSRASFSRHFQQFAGQSFTSFLQRVRLEHCRRLLATGDYTVTEAALASGFQNLSHFNRLFRRHWGITPREFCRQVG